MEFLDTNLTKESSLFLHAIQMQMTSHNVLNMSLFNHFFKVLSLYLEARIRIRIRISPPLDNLARGKDKLHGTPLLVYSTAMRTERKFQKGVLK